MSWLARSASERPWIQLTAASLAATRAPLLSMAAEVSNTRATAIFWFWASTSGASLATSWPLSATRAPLTSEASPV